MTDIIEVQRHSGPPHPSPLLGSNNVGVDSGGFGNLDRASALVFVFPHLYSTENWYCCKARLHLVRHGLLPFIRSNHTNG